MWGADVDRKGRNLWDGQVIRREVKRHKATIKENLNFPKSTKRKNILPVNGKDHHQSQ